MGTQTRVGANIVVDWLIGPARGVGWYWWIDGTADIVGPFDGRLAAERDAAGS